MRLAKKIVAFIFVCGAAGCVATLVSLLLGKFLGENGKIYLGGFITGIIIVSSSMIAGHKLFRKQV